MMEMPKYQWPQLRATSPRPPYTAPQIFLRRAGAIILGSTIVLWALLSFPRPRRAETDRRFDRRPDRRGIEIVVAPIGFNHDIALALLPAMAAREVAVIVARDRLYDRCRTRGRGQSAVDRRVCSSRWSLPTALAFLAWFVFAPQCLSTIAVTRRETNGWKWPFFMLAYLFILAYVAAGADLLDGDRSRFIAI